METLISIDFLLCFWLCLRKSRWPRVGRRKSRS